MAIFNSPRSFQNVNAIAIAQAPMSNRFFISAHESHPPFFQLVLLVFSAVLEVVCVSLPGYIVARQGMFDADAQKLVANLNVTLFTPCLSMDSSVALTMGYFCDIANSYSFYQAGLTTNC